MLLLLLLLLLFTGLGRSVLGETVPSIWVPPSAGTQDLGHSFSQYGPPSRWITYISKINLYRIQGIALDWSRSYLTNRTQRCLVNGSLSRVCSPKGGVPQGTILGPLSCLILFYFVVFLGQAEYSYFSADFRLKIFLYYSLVIASDFAILESIGV